MNPLSVRPAARIRSAGTLFLLAATLGLATVVPDALHAQLVTGRFTTSLYTWEKFDAENSSATYLRGFQNVQLTIAQGDVSFNTYMQGAIMTDGEAGLRVVRILEAATESMARRGRVVELNAETVMLTCGDDLVAHAGRLAREEAEQLGRVIVASWRASAQVAKLLGREKVRFEQSMHEGGDYVLYSLSVAGEMVLSVVLNSHTPLGIVRYHTKHTAETIAKLTTSA